MILYRAGLVTAGASFVVAASAAFLPDNLWASDIIKQNLDLLYAVGGAGLGLSLVLIHIYVTQIKRTLQALWALGVVGSLLTYARLAQPAGEGLVQYVIDNPTAVWFVGPLFAALTGLVFKEGIHRRTHTFVLLLCRFFDVRMARVVSHIETLFLQIGLCYGKLEAGLLTFIVPTALLGHLVKTPFLSTLISVSGDSIHVRNMC